MNNEFLPMSPEESGQFDYIVVTPDAYVDHPSFAAAIIGRYVQSLGFRVGIIAQPDWRGDADFNKLGTPRYAFLLSGGNMDGIVNMYTAAKRLRGEDAYSPGGKTGLRPPRPTIAYTARLKQSHKDTPVIIGGIEPSQRRFAHYDYYEDKVRRSYLVDSKADMLVYGMGERPLAEICTRLQNGESITDLIGIRGTCILRHSLDGMREHIALPSFERVTADKKAFADAFKLIYKNAVPDGKTLVQRHGDRQLIQFPPSLPLSTPEMDSIYNLPFTKRAHPSYTEPIPALTEVQFGITALRGCPGMCAFCSISAHQGKSIQKRSKKSIVEETRRITQMSEFKGNISDVGGPTANFYDAICTAKNSKSCTRACLSPKICPSLKISHKGISEVLEAVERVPGVKRVFIRSGLRFDYIMADKDNRFFERLVKKHVSGQLKVAPEHVCQDVLALMNKPHYGVYERFAQRFAGATKRAGKPQFLLPYYISSHPGSTLADAIELAVTLKKQGFVPDQVQDFYPTPGTLSTCMYHTGLDPLSGKSVYVAATQKDKAMQRALLAFDKKRNWPVIRQALIEAGREDLMGHGKDCLVPQETGRPNVRGLKGSSPAVKSNGPVVKSNGPVVKSNGPARKSSGPAAKSSRPAVKNDGHFSKGNGHAAKSSDSAEKSSGPVRKGSIPVAKSSGPVAKSSGTAAKSSGHVAKGSGTAAKSSRPAVKSDGYAAKSGGHAVKSNGPVAKGSGTAAKSSRPAVKSDGYAAKSGGYASKDRKRK